MAKNALALLDDTKKGLPAHIQKALGEKKNIEDRSNVNALGVTGKVFSVSINGEVKKLTRVDAETGDVNPLGTVRAIILDYGKRRGRAFYEGDYDPAKTAAPVCWSVDGLKPEDKVPEKQSPKCDGCPQSIKGSKTSTNGKASVACSQHRMVALLIVGQKGLEMTPLRLKLAITSDWDNQNKELNEDGWFAFQNYTDMLRTKAVNHTAALITKITFDPNEAYPKLIFSPDKWVDEATLEAIQPLLDSDEVKELLNATYTPAGIDGKKTEVEQYTGKKAAATDDDAPVTTKKKAAVVEEDPPVRTPSTKKKAPVVIDEVATEVADEDDEEAALAAKLAEIKAKKAAAAKAAEAPATRKKATPADDDAPTARKKATPVDDDAPAARTTTKKTAAAPVENLLEDWKEDDE